eukprot:s581_g40.t1
MTWLDELMWTWVKSVAPYASHAAACRFGADWAKTWCFVSNKSDIFALGLSCIHGPGTHESVVGVRLPDGTFKSRLTAEYPSDLALALAKIIQPFTTLEGRYVKLSEWKTLLPSKLLWPCPVGRIEDGGGLPSTALRVGSLSITPWPKLRKLWFHRLCASFDCRKIVAHLATGNPSPPLNDEELQPYLDDLLQVFGVQHLSDNLLQVAPGQPFRLRLWKLLASSWNDPDVSFLDTLAVGVRLGVHGHLDPSPAWPAKYAQVAVGKLGLVLAEGRSPRLVVDSSIPNVTSNTVIPNHMMLPKISDVMQCAPSTLAAEQLTQLTLDVSKAHRRVLIHPDDRGLLCFHVGDDLYQSICLNFGARASGWYWGRVAGLMVRTSHALLDHHHALWQYVDDLLVWLDKKSAPLWASSLVILFLLLGIPMSWHKAALAPCLTWIGWSICVETWTVQIPHSKLTTILNQLVSLLKDRTVPLKDLQSTLGRLLWLTSAWHHLRPLLIPLYRSLRNIPVTMVGVNPVTFQQISSLVDDSLMLTKPLLHQHHSLDAGVFVKRVANTFVTTRDELNAVHTKSRRIWLGITDPMSPSRLLDDDACAALQAWQEILSSASLCVSMKAPQILPVQATADAMASADVAGLGGAAFFADGSCVWFQFRISLADAQKCFHWVSDNMQRHIAAWELLAQFVLTYCIETRLPLGHFPLVCHQGTDNSAADATASKGLTMTPGMSHILSQFFLFMRRHHVYAEITHIPGHLNTLADAFSRFEDPPFKLEESSQIPIKWQALMCQNDISVIQPDAKWPSTFCVRSA